MEGGVIGIVLVGCVDRQSMTPKPLVQCTFPRASHSFYQPNVPWPSTTRFVMAQNSFDFTSRMTQNQVARRAWGIQMTKSCNETTSQGVTGG